MLTYSHFQAHNRCMRKFILYAFDMAREIQITPRRISYAREKEAELYESLMDIASRKQDEIRTVITETVTKLKEDLLDTAAAYEFKGPPYKFLCEKRKVRNMFKFFLYANFIRFFKTKIVFQHTVNCLLIY